VPHGKLHTFTVGHRDNGSGKLENVLRLYKANDDDSGWTLVNTWSATATAVTYNATYTASAITSIIYSPDGNRCKVYAVSQYGVTNYNQFVYNIDGLNGTLSCTSFVGGAATGVIPNSFNGYDFGGTHPRSNGVAGGQQDNIAMDNNGKVWYAPNGQPRNVASVSSTGTVTSTAVLPNYGTDHAPVMGAGGYSGVGVHGNRVFISYEADRAPATSTRSWVVVETDGVSSSPVNIIDAVETDSNFTGGRISSVSCGPDNGMVAACINLENATGIQPIGIFEV